MVQVIERTREVHVYPFGTRWHWKCGARPDGDGHCLGGPARTEEDARAAGDVHLAEEHTVVYDAPVHPDGCRHCGVEVADHGLQDAEGVGVHEFRAPRPVQVAARRRQMRRVR